MADAKVAIVADWLIGGGAERVVYEMHKLYPQAPIYTTYYDERTLQQFKGADIRVSYMQKFPFSKLRKFLPILRQRWFESLDLKQYDLVLSSSGAEAKSVRTRPDAVHIAYCHTPTHYYWVRYQEYLEQPGFGVLDPLARVGLKLLVKPNRRWDYSAAQHANYIVANSTAVQARIKEFYARDSVVIHPPVDTARFQSNTNQTRAGFVIAGRQTPYKRIDLAVAACTLAKLPLTVIGNGPDHRKLRRMAGDTITFATQVDDKDIANYFQKAEAFIFPNEDDFGITPVEALAAGTPVIAYKAGGALDYVIDGKTGLFFTEQDPVTLANVLTDFKPDMYNHEHIAQHAEKFSIAVFQDKLSSFIKQATTEK